MTFDLNDPRPIWEQGLSRADAVKGTDMSDQTQAPSSPQAPTVRSLLADAAHYAEQIGNFAWAKSARAALSAQSSGEPAAWRYCRKGWERKIWRLVHERPTDFECAEDWIVEPLYASPSPQPDTAEIAKLREQLVSAQWQPIETAPKGRLLLVGFFNELGKWRSMHAQYRDDLPQHDDADFDDEPAEAGWYEGSLEAEVLFPVSPTYWMPLPAPPALTDETGT